jgi:spermidine synthase
LSLPRPVGAGYTRTIDAAAGSGVDPPYDDPMPAVVRTFEEAGQRLTLRDLGTHHEVLLGQVPILSSASLATERAFGALAGRLDPGAPLRRVLVGGLGFGATLSGVLDVAGPETEVVVVEKLATVIALLGGELSRLAPGALDDPRVRLAQEDVAEAIARERGLDAILLDVDNGPGWASFRANARLYTPAGLAAARGALRPGGSLAVWSGYAADAFVGRLRRAGLVPSVVPLQERGVVRARAYVGRSSRSGSE